MGIAAAKRCVISFSCRGDAANECKFFRRIVMAKGQIRSNREQKKPKKDKTKPAAPVSPFGSAQGSGPVPKSKK
jgi:hypothetical protein